MRTNTKPKVERLLTALRGKTGRPVAPSTLMARAGFTNKNQLTAMISYLRNRRGFDISAVPGRSGLVSYQLG